MKGVELVHYSSETWWEEVRATDDAGTSPAFNYTISFVNTLLSHVECLNN